MGGKVGVVTGLEIATITLESQKRPTDQKINPPVDPMKPDHRRTGRILGNCLLVLSILFYFTSSLFKLAFLSDTENIRLPSI